jgi:hypothetical protein
MGHEMTERVNKNYSQVNENVNKVEKAGAIFG